MSFDQIYQTVTRSRLLNEVLQFKQEGWQLTQISATFKGKYDLLYTFERDYHMINLRLTLLDGEWIDSVTSVFPYAYLYENEIRDLFGVEINGINVDFQGKLYQMAVKAPFHVETAEEAD